MGKSISIPTVVVTIVLLVILQSFVFSYTQYLHHRAALKVVDPHVKYGYFHHIGIVTIPLIKYRLQSRFKSHKLVIKNK